MDCLQNTLLEASLKGDVATVREVISRGGRLNLSGKHGSSPLHNAASSSLVDPVGAVEVCKLLCEAKASVNARDGMSNSPLHLCALSQGPGIWAARVLLAYGADHTLKNDEGERPLDLLLRTGQKTKELEDFAIVLSQRSLQIPVDEH
eukprot:TRINITY_DN5809_c0_g2_i1.p1 TRINITY_DN5809_c0_g2~~TRINITY_DN5809_c0_g2_i1.p1  ORF type:complete len:148 (+),score=16.64 TRINITY_DN5809_c0_g2_i1:68-511(+)